MITERVQAQVYDRDEKRMKRVTVIIDIDLAQIVNELAPRAYHSKGHKSAAIFGGVVVTIGAPDA